MHSVWNQIVVSLETSNCVKVLITVNVPLRGRAVCKSEKHFFALFVVSLLSRSYNGLLRLWLPQPVTPGCLFTLAGFVAGLETKHL